MKKMVIMSGAAAMLAAAGCVSANRLSDCDMTLGGIRFTKSINGGDNLVKDEDGRVVMHANPHADFFIFADDSQSSMTDAGAVFKEVDNTQPWTFTARLKCGFTPEGLYNAAVLFVYANDELWQKLCFEQDERGNHRIVSVRTIGTSDDNNHEVFNDAEHIYFRISSIGSMIAWYHSQDGVKWQRVRLYKNEYPAKLYLGFYSQAPQSDDCISEFDHMSFSQEGVKDIWMGE